MTQAMMNTPRWSSEGSERHDRRCTTMLPRNPRPLGMAFYDQDPEQTLGSSDDEWQLCAHPGRSRNVSRFSEADIGSAHAFDRHVTED
jgi:hypothetical protein